MKAAYCCVIQRGYRLKPDEWRDKIHVLDLHVGTSSPLGMMIIFNDDDDYIAIMMFEIRKR